MFGHPDTVPYLRGVVLASVFFLVLFVTTDRVLREKRVAPTPIVRGTPERLETMSNNFRNPFTDMGLRARTAYVFNPQTGEVFFERNAALPLPLASLAKLMTALVAKENASYEEVATITYQDLAQDGSSDFLPGERWRLGDLIAFTLISSSNDGAYAVASAVGSLTTASGTTAEFVRAMNARGSALGLPSTRFENPTGLDVIDGVQAGAYGSARDVAHLLAYILAEHPDILEVTNKQAAVFTSLDNYTHRAKNTNDEVTSIPWLIGSKTGLTDLAGGNLAIAFDAGLGQPIIAVVLGSTKNERFTDIEQLAHATFAYLSSR